MSRERTSEWKPPEITVVIAFDRAADTAQSLIEELIQALATKRFEIIAFDDGSGDGTLEVLADCATRHPELRVYHHRVSTGQSAAIRTGVELARALWVATLDGDGQTVPIDIRRLLEARDRCADERIKLFTGWRYHRADPWRDRLASRIGNVINRLVLDDTTPDPACGVKLFERDAYLALPAFECANRFASKLMQCRGWRVESIKVGHRARTTSRAAYPARGRLLREIRDVLGVAWLSKRIQVPNVRAVCPRSERQRRPIAHMPDAGNPLMR
jgi:dolichol-phosphate mannosyltransferase